MAELKLVGRIDIGNALDAVGVPMPTPDDPIKRGNLRHATRAVCGSCSHTWLAPKIGNCPKCGSSGAVPVGTQDCNYVRV